MKIYHIAAAAISFPADAGSALEPKPALRRNLKGEGNDGCPVGKTQVFYSRQDVASETFEIFPANNPRIGLQDCIDFPVPDGLPNPGSDLKFCRGDTVVAGPIPFYADKEQAGEPVGNRFTIGTVVTVSPLAFEISGTLVFDDDDQSEIHFIGYAKDGEDLINDLPIAGGTGQYEGVSGDAKILPVPNGFQELKLCLL